MLDIRWLIRNTHCSGNYLIFEDSEARQLVENPDQLFANEPFASYEPYSTLGNQPVGYAAYECTKNIDISLDYKYLTPHYIESRKAGGKKQVVDIGSSSTRQKRSGVVEVGLFDFLFYIIYCNILKHSF